MNKQEKRQIISDMRKSNKGYGEIAKELNISKNYVKWYCRNNGLGGFRACEPNGLSPKQIKIKSCIRCGKDFYEKRKRICPECRLTETIAEERECRICKCCNNLFKPKTYNQIFCTKDCKLESYTKKKGRCEICGNLIQNQNHFYKYCSVECANKSKSKRRRKTKDIDTSLFVQGLKPTENKIFNRIKTISSKYEYIGGYTTCDGYIYVVCNDCGVAYRCSAQGLRHNYIKECPCCTQINLKYQRDLLAQKQEEEKQRLVEELKIKKTELKKQRELDRLLNANYSQQSIKICAECGNIFYGKSQKYCSEICHDKNYRRQHSGDKRLKRVKIKDYSINLKKLAERDNNICYLCGCSVDWNDFYIDTRGTIICGSNYPSIEHVIPLSHGGSHTWDNVKLACRKCNWEKGDKIG